MAIKTKTFLRRAEREDLDTVVDWVEDPDFLQFLYGDPARSPKQVRAHIVGMLGRSPGDAAPAAIYLIIDSDEYGPVGLASLQNISWRNRSCSIDLYIGRKEMRASFVTPIAMLRVLEYCFDELNLHRVTAYIFAFNRASWRLMERTGTPREFTLADHVVRNGELHDLYAYGLLRPEYEAFRAKIGYMGEDNLARMIAERQEAQDGV